LVAYSYTPGVGSVPMVVVVAGFQATELVVEAWYRSSI
jgi:hypothetical protein